LTKMKHRMKIYCPDCMRLVGHQNTKSPDGSLRVVCGRCGKPLYDFDGNLWTYLKKTPETTS
jgi:hypothetical protein